MPAAGLTGSAAESICLDCGLCCNGVIFGDVELQPEDDTTRLQSLGLAVKIPADNRSRKNPYFFQPCAAYDGCQCGIYADRPRYCRDFDCVLLKSVQDGRTGPETALGIIQTARQRVDTVHRLLRQLGDTGEATALAARFRRTTKRLEKARLDGPMTQAYGQLTLAVHDLNLLLGKAFYPGLGEPASPIIGLRQDPKRSNIDL